MSAVLKDYPVFSAMRVSDLDQVMDIENAVYSHPWTRGNFSDSLGASYHCRTLRMGEELLGYFVMIVAVGEAHLLNVSVAAQRQRQGLGSSLLREVMRCAREHGARHLFLEVRPSNLPARGLYERFGFQEIALRRGYYPAQVGREDAIVLTLDL